MIQKTVYPNLTNKLAGFTLVELAIVMVIIGLLIGGIIKGQEMILTARATTTIAQINSYEAAIITFRDRFDALPGDMRFAATRIPGCNANCAPFMPGGGDGVIGNPDWLADWTTQTVSPMPLPPASVNDETTLFWLHLMKADLIGGITDNALRGATATWGETHPISKFKGGFIVGTANGSFRLTSLSTPHGTFLAYLPGGLLHPSPLTSLAIDVLGSTPWVSRAYAGAGNGGGGNGNGNGGGFAGPGCPGGGNGPGNGAGCGLGGGNNGGGGGGGGANAAPSGPSGTVIAMINIPTTSGIQDLSTPGLQPMSAAEAARIDRKMDDGFPHTGQVYAYGLISSCFTSDTILEYRESVSSRDCGLVFRIGK